MRGKLSILTNILTNWHRTLHARSNLVSVLITFLRQKPAGNSIDAKLSANGRHGRIDVTQRQTRCRVIPQKRTLGKHKRSWLIAENGFGNAENGLAMPRIARWQCREWQFGAPARLFGFWLLHQPGPNIQKPRCNTHTHKRNLNHLKRCLAWDIHRYQDPRHISSVSSHACPSTQCGTVIARV